MSRVVDAHHHLWSFTEAEYGWIGEDMAEIRRDFTPQMLRSQLVAAGVDASVAVQARQSLEETDWLLSVAADSPVIDGVVGWFPLSDPDVEKEIVRRLDTEAGGRLVGARHVVQDEPDPRFILGSAFNRGVDVLGRQGLVYDLLLFERQLPEAIEFVDRHPNQRFVLDHVAKPLIAKGEMEPWATRIRELSRRENVSCKLSGMVTEARWENWSRETLEPYMDQVFEAFGPKRLMFGSDWPVCLVASSYEGWYQTVRSYCASLSADEQAWVFGRSVEQAYRLEVE